MQPDQPKIFLVDDDLFCLKLMEQAIRSQGYHDIQTFENGSDCLNSLTEEPDIIFLDQMMGSVSGMDALKAIKRFNPDIFVVFVSGQQQVEVAVESLKFGAFDYIVKNESQRTKVSSVLEKIMRVRQRLNQRKPVHTNRFFSLFQLFFLLLALLLLPGCTQNLFQAAGRRPDAAPLQAPLDYQYRLRPEDKLSLSVWDHEELSVGSVYSAQPSTEPDARFLLVDSNGEVTVPKLGKVALGGLTVPEAEETLKARFGKSVVNPLVTVQVLNKEVTVLGEVNTPGKLVLDKDRTSLVQVLGRAGDFNNYADKRLVKVLRQQGSKVQESVFDLTRMDTYVQSNTLIMPGDVVYVPAKSSKEFERKSGGMLAVASGLSAIIIITRLFLSI
ncbi:response regulator [Hymenobacter rigui]|uniref:Response regulator n=1 Tax=Hymenobacter rigui TaxID=334424 RepID=A0A3R9PPN6_9BACT|nr:response regulator [Hymenobacter rigui]RSK43096.1 response regulator [Hymenobacter rigui]